MVQADRWRSAALIGAAAGLVVQPLVGGSLFLVVVVLSRARRPSMVRPPAIVTAVVLLVAASLTATTAPDWLLGIALAAFVPLVSVWSARSVPGDTNTVAVGLALGIAVHLVAGLFASPVVPMRGVSAHANALGALAALAAPSVLAMAMRHARLPGWWIATAVVAGVTVATGSRGALVALLVGVAYVLVAWGTGRSAVDPVSWRHARRAALVLVVIVALVTSWAWVRQPTANDAVGLTGRATLWGVAIEAIYERPVLGHGPEAWSRVAPSIEPSVDPRRFPNSHNGYLELALIYGVVGLSVVVAFLASVYRTLARGPATLTSAAARATVLAFAVVNLVEAFVVDGRFLAIVILVAGAGWYASARDLRR